ncbi:uncharacterized protein APUU_50860S [Aspergillus puulaauensis]|uniref:Uncharacterized protein n=1 Tax=Aspergillus puulaauensis TaxID=1220207 RepID=A0A7R7XRK2_9EURO|nr:uncharacterized protein APUU_50860S [Aspergillus puulaauensis]BCS26149.1 hypothetical protein APUU_50860S [Aspergillus puulaauensis]
MSTSGLGESWVVASVDAEREDTTVKRSPRTPRQARTGTQDGSNHGLDSTASSVSGPELIMPSIYETPISEASWVAPAVRAKQPSPNIRRRHQPSAETTKEKKAVSDAPNKNARSTTTSKDQTRTRFTLFETPIRSVINLILLAGISHLLILPELLQQYPSMCSMDPLSALYPSPCRSHLLQSFSPEKNSQSAPIEAVLSFQIHLESLFNATLHEIAPLKGSLKQTESQLRTVQRGLKHAHPGTKHELDLEFESCWRAIRIAGWKFDTLKADLQSAVDSLVAAGNVKPNSRSSIAQDARLSTQMLRREQYIEQLMARMRSKADSLAADLVTLDDHLESIENIVDRESETAPTYSPKDSASRLIAFVEAIVPPSLSLPSFLRPAQQDTPADDSDDASPLYPKLTISQTFHEATTHHRPVANIARNLSQKIQQSLQKKRNTIH